MALGIWIPAKCNKIGTKVNEAYEAIGTRATFVTNQMLEIFWYSDDQGNVKATFVERSLCFGKNSAVISKKEYEGIFK